jgi:hypothetical protein
MPGYLFRSIVEFATEIYDRLPAIVRLPGDRLIQALKVSAAFLGEIRLPVLLCECSSPGSGLDCRLLYVGRREQLQPALSLFQYQLIRETRVDFIYCWQIKNFLDRYPAREEVPFLHLNLILCRWLSGQDFILVPPSVKTVLSLAETLEQTQAALSATTKRKIRKTVLNGYSWHIARGAESLRRFYHDFYRAFALERFGVFAHVASFQKVRRLYRTGVLVFLQRDNETVAASICRKIDGVLWFELFGRAIHSGKVLDQDSGDAMYHALLELAYELGCTHINFRESRPFLNDGALQYKLRWGGHLHYDHRAPRLVAVDIRCLDRDRLHPFLDHYPVVLDDRCLSGLVLLAQGHGVTAQELRKISNTFLRPGLTKLAVWSLSGFAGHAQPHPGESADRLELIDLSVSRPTKGPVRHVPG